MLTTAPRPALRIAGTAYRHMRTMLVTLTRQPRSHPPGPGPTSTVVASPMAPPTPTLLTRMCRAPKHATVRSTTARHASSSVTSAWITSHMLEDALDEALPCEEEEPSSSSSLSSSIIRLVSVAQARSMSTSATLAPCRASRMAVALPLPISPLKRAGWLETLLSDNGLDYTQQQQQQQQCWDLGR